jgi:3-phenylpropionate/cinnamic acid dioxygenase small subunit
MANIQLLLDKETIRDLRTTWGEALDNKNWEQFRSIFTPEIDTDFTAWGVPAQRITREHFVGMFSTQSFKRAELITQHLYTNFRIHIDQDTATSICNFQGHHHIPNFEGGDHYCLHGEYTDHLIRTPQGWKIAGIKLRVFFHTGNQNILTY